MLFLRLRSIASYTLDVHHNIIATTTLSTRGGSNHYCKSSPSHSSLYSSSVATRIKKTQLYSRKSSSSTTKQLLKTIEGNDIYAAEQVIKKSRFIGLATHCTSWEDAQSIIDDIRKEHAKSRHVCFGFVSSSSGGGVGTERASDDGEPTGKWCVLSLFFTSVHMADTSEQYDFIIHQEREVCRSLDLSMGKDYQMYLLQWYDILEGLSLEQESPRLYCFIV